MKVIRDIAPLLIVLVLTLFLGACAAAVPGGAPVGTPSGGTVAAPSEFLGATGEKTSTVDGDEKAVDGVAQSNITGDAPGIPPAPGNTTTLPLGIAEGMYAYNPNLGGFPAPIQDFPVYKMSIDGKVSICRASSESLLVTIEGFVKKPVGWKNLDSENAYYAYEDLGNDYAISIQNYNEGIKFEQNLQSVTAGLAYEGVERTGFFSAAIPISDASYPKAVYSLKFDAVPAKSHFITIGAAVMPIGGEIIPWTLLQNLPQDPAKFALCPPPPTLIKDVMTLTE